MRVRLTSQAWRDIDAIGDWIAPDNPNAAIALTDDLLDRAYEIGDNPFRFPAIVDHVGETLRKRSHRHYVIIYRVLATEVEVLRITNGRRDYLSSLQDL